MCDMSKLQMGMSVLMYQWLMSVICVVLSVIISRYYRDHLALSPSVYQKMSVRVVYTPILVYYETLKSLNFASIGVHKKELHLACLDICYVSIHANGWQSRLACRRKLITWG